jgi:predicted HTH transcriptional regulator
LKTSVTNRIRRCRKVLKDLLSGINRIFQRIQNKQMATQQTILDLKAALELGEGQFIEFKELPDKNLPKEMVAFANASGGVIYLGINDLGKIKGIETTNKLKSQIQDTARNCDPPVAVLLRKPYKYIISSKIRCVHFNDNKRVDILDKKEVDRGIIGNIEFAIAYLKERIPVRFEIKDLKRDEFPEYPIEAYREAIVNAVSTSTIF